VILDLTPPEIKGIGFILNNEGSKEPLKSFAMTIDEVEKATGIDFFPQLPADLEKELEGTVNVDKWFKGR
jgi:endonuclease G, mitochondrial